MPYIYSRNISKGIPGQALFLHQFLTTIFDAAWNYNLFFCRCFSVLGIITLSHFYIANYHWEGKKCEASTNSNLTIFIAILHNPHLHMVWKCSFIELHNHTENYIALTLSLQWEQIDQCFFIKPLGYCQNKTDITRCIHTAHVWMLGMSPHHFFEYFSLRILHTTKCNQE